MADHPPRRTGRPPLDASHPSVHVSLRLPSSQYDALYLEAQRERLNVSDIIRRRLSSAEDEQDE